MEKARALSALLASKGATAAPLPAPAAPAQPAQPAGTPGRSMAVASSKGFAAELEINNSVQRTIVTRGPFQDEVRRGVWCGP